MAVSNAGIVFVAASNATKSSKQRAHIVCDGVDDDLDFEYAFSLLPRFERVGAMETHGIVELSEGTFILGGDIDIPARGITFQGQGQGTVLKMADGVNEHIINTGDFSNLTIRDMFLDGNKENCDTGDAIHMGGTVNTEISNVYIHNAARYGVYAKHVNGTMLHLNRVYVNSPRTTGIWIEDYKGVTLTNCVSERVDADWASGVVLKNVTSATIDGFWSEIVYYPINLAGATCYVTVTGAHLRNAKDRAITIGSEAHDNIFINTYCFDSEQEDVNIYGDNNLFVGGYFPNGFRDLGAGNQYPVLLCQEQTQNDTDVLLDSGLRTRVGQRLTLSDASISSLSFLLRKDGTPEDSDITFTVRKVSDDTILGGKILGTALTLHTTDTWETVTLDTPIPVNEEIRISCEYGGTAAYPTNAVVFRYMASDVVANEYMDWYVDDWTGGNEGIYDAAYQLTCTR